MRSAVYALVAVWVILGNGAWYACKIVLMRNGYPVSWLCRHFRDIANMRKLIAAG